jgi:hypothetical protein
MKKHTSNAKRSMKPRKRLNANVEKATNVQTNKVAEPPDRRFPVPVAASRFLELEEKL